MTDCIRPCLYDAYHHIVPVDLKQTSDQQIMSVDIVGPVCESGDFLAKNRKLEFPMTKNTLLAILDTGAYVYSMSSNYNLRPKAGEFLIEGSQLSCIRRRQTFQDMFYI